MECHPTGPIPTGRDLVLAASHAPITIQAPRADGPGWVRKSVADRRAPDSWLVRKHRCFGGSWCRPTARSGAFTITSTCSRSWACRPWPPCSPAALVLVGIWRTWDFPAVVDVLIAGVLFPFAALFIFTAFPLPCAVFAWKAAGGEVATAGECFAWCRRRAGRLCWLLFRLSLIWLGSLLFFGLPLLWFWPRTCLTPLVALFEDERRIFRRSRRMLREDSACSLMGFLYLGMGIVLGGLIVLPRLLFGTRCLAHTARRALAAGDRRSPLDLRDDVRHDPPDRHRDELVDLAHPGLPRHPIGSAREKTSSAGSPCSAPSWRRDGVHKHDGAAPGGGGSGW